jgi:hypothetical protein
MKKLAFILLSLLSLNAFATFIFVKDEMDTDGVKEELIVKSTNVHDHYDIFYKLSWSDLDDDTRINSFKEVVGETIPCVVEKNMAMDVTKLFCILDIEGTSGQDKEIMTFKRNTKGLYDISVHDEFSNGTSTEPDMIWFDFKHINATH